MRSQERFEALFKRKQMDRLPVVEWAPWWNLTVDRWHRDGMPAELNGVLDVQKFFGLDPVLQTGFWAKKPGVPEPKAFGAGIMWNEADYEETKKFLFPTPDELYYKYDFKSHFERLRKWRNEDDAVHFFTVEGMFWYPRELFGIEAHLYSFYDEEELLKRMLQEYTDWLKTIFPFIAENFKFDFMSFAEDMSYNNGPMISKDLFDEFLAPYYKQLIPILKKMDVPVFIDSDGDITKAVDWYAEVGADGMFPLERQAGVDVSLYLAKQPDMVFMGHFDKMCMKFGEEAMRKEFERLLPSAKTGRLIMSCDHQTPPDVSIDNYRTYVKLFFEYAQKAVRK